MADIWQMTFSMRFLELTLFYFDLNFIEINFQGSSWQYVIIGLANGSVLSMHQVITWSRVDPFHWPKYESSGLNELIKFLSLNDMIKKYLSVNHALAINGKYNIWMA